MSVAYCPNCSCDNCRLVACAECRRNLAIVEQWSEATRAMAHYVGCNSQQQFRQWFARCRHADERFLQHKARGGCNHKGWAWCWAGEQSLRQQHDYGK